MKSLMRCAAILSGLWLVPAGQCSGGENSAAAFEIASAATEGDTISYLVSVSSASRVRVVEIVFGMSADLEFLSWEDGDFMPRSLRIGPTLLDEPTRLLVAFATVGKTVVTESSGTVGTVTFVRSPGSAAVPTLLKASLVDDRFREDWIVTPSSEIRPSAKSPEHRRVPRGFSLRSVGPNPTSRYTTVRFEIPRPGSEVRLRVYDVTGRAVRALMNERKSAGYYSVIWDLANDRGHRVAPGIYFVRMEAEKFIKTTKVVLVE